ncbi:MAG: LysR family transcriptional regulator [Methyloligellaceae bacterium]
MHVTLRQLTVFRAVASLGGFTRAANELGLTQPAVSLQVKQLEDQLGLALFERGGRKLELTAAGARVLETTQAVDAQLSTLEQSLAQLKGGVSGHLVIAGVTTTKYVAPHLLGAFLRRYPLVTPKLTVTNRQNVLRRLKERQDDLVLMGRVPNSIAVDAHPFVSNPLVLAAPRDHPMASRKEIMPEQLAQLPMLMREPGSGTRLAVEEFLRARGVVANVVMELGSGEAIKQAVIAGLGISVLSLHSLRLELAAGLVKLLPVEGFPLEKHWYAVVPHGKQLRPVAQTFLDFLATDGAELLKASAVSR